MQSQENLKLPPHGYGTRCIWRNHRGILKTEPTDSRGMHLCIYLGIFLAQRQHPPAKRKHPACVVPTLTPSVSWHHRLCPDCLCCHRLVCLPPPLGLQKELSPAMPCRDRHTHSGSWVSANPLFCTNPDTSPEKGSHLSCKVLSLHQR